LPGSSSGAEHLSELKPIFKPNLSASDEMFNRATSPVVLYELFLADALRYKLASVGIDVLALCPGIADTDFHVISGNETVGALPVGPLVELGLSQLNRRAPAIPICHNRMLAGLLKCAPRRLQTMIAGTIMGRLTSS
jgi:hypothetical protein